MSDKQGTNMNFTPLFFAILSGIIVALFVFWLNSEKFDVRYTLSEKIPLRFNPTQEEAVQQIQIKNLSRKPVERIQVKLPSKLLTFEVAKNSQADVVDHFKNTESEEFVYPILPPGGSFNIVFKTSGSEIGKDEIAVSHTKGKGVYALDAGKPFSVLLLSTAPFLLWLVLSILSLRSTTIDSWKWTASYTPEAVLKKKKPFYMPQEKWEQLRNSALANLGGDNRSDELEKLSSYRWLDQDRDALEKFLSKTELERVIETCGDELLGSVKNRVYWGMDVKQCVRALDLKKPQICPAQRWEDIRLVLQKAYIQSREKASDGSIPTLLKEQKPQRIDEIEWNECQKQLARNWVESISVVMQFEDAPLDYLSREDTSGLSKEMQDRLRGSAYKLQLLKLPDLTYPTNAQAFLATERPLWLRDDDHRSLRRVAEGTLKANVAESLLYVLNCVVDGAKIPEYELAQLPEAIKQKVQALDKKFAADREKIASTSEQINKEGKQVRADRELVLKQLKIINDVFVDPKSIERIEPYDNPFATGNFELLRKLSQLLSKTR